MMIGNFPVVVVGGDTGRKRRRKVALVVLSGMSLERVIWESVVSWGVAGRDGIGASRVNEPSGFCVILRKL